VKVSVELMLARSALLGAVALGGRTTSRPPTMHGPRSAIGWLWAGTRRPSREQQAASRPAPRACRTSSTTRPFQQSAAGTLF